ncbi:MAG: hypothetical protein HRT87_05425 [Legionellales bacterium]|nr:hypothetical protein [Legionellales bacterium]
MDRGWVTDIAGFGFFLGNVACIAWMIVSVLLYICLRADNYEGDELDEFCLTPSLLRFAMGGWLLIFSMFYLRLFGFLQESVEGVSVFSGTIFRSMAFSSVIALWFASWGVFFGINWKNVVDNKLLFVRKFRRTFLFYASFLFFVGSLLFLLKVFDGYVVEIVNILSWFFDVPATNSNYPGHESMGVALSMGIFLSLCVFFTSFLYLGACNILSKFHYFNIKYIFKKILVYIKQIKKDKARIVGLLINLLLIGFMMWGWWRIRLFFRG